MKQNGDSIMHGWAEEGIWIPECLDFVSNLPIHVGVYWFEGVWVEASVSLCLKALWVLSLPHLNLSSAPFAWSEQFHIYEHLGTIVRDWRREHSWNRWSLDSQRAKLISRSLVGHLSRVTSQVRKLWRGMLWGDQTIYYSIFLIMVISQLLLTF